MLTNETVERCLEFLINTKQLSKDKKRVMFKGICTNYGRTALCLSGGATFAYLHFGVVKALLEEGLLPTIITGTSGGALVAALVATRTDEELKQLLVPALAHRIKACHESWWTRTKRWWKKGALFDAVDWARKCSWFTYGSLTFREAYERTGRILNVTCVPNDPHSPTILCNYITCPDVVIWSAVLASAAVPGILPPVVLMSKTSTGKLVPYSFGHRWKDGSLRTDIPIKDLNMQFNVRFTIVSQVNPHINLFFYSSRGSVGQPVFHRKGRGWRGGWLLSATEKSLLISMDGWMRWLRQVELLPRWMGQDWSMLWLQKVRGNITIWPTHSHISDFWNILDDPGPSRLARQIHEGMISTYPTIKFLRNRHRIESLTTRGRTESRKAESATTVTTSDGAQAASNGGEKRIDDAAADFAESAAPSLGQLPSLSNLDAQNPGYAVLRNHSIEEILSENELRDEMSRRRGRSTSRTSQSRFSRLLSANGAAAGDGEEEEEDEDDYDENGVGEGEVDEDVDDVDGSVGSDTLIPDGY
jgi:predicted acylesterase/phospholipase RssA